MSTRFCVCRPSAPSIVENDRADFSVLSTFKARMKIIRTPSLLLFSALMLSTQVAVSADDTYQVKFNLGVVESWRVTPSGVLKWCRTADPEGVERRQAAYQDWLARNESLIGQVNENFLIIVPLISPSRDPRVSMVDAVRAHIAIESDRLYFFGKSQGEVASFCQSYVIEQGSERIRKALAELEKWRAQHVPVQ